MARPKHADTRYLELKNGKYRVTVAVPRALQGTLGIKLKRPLNTDSRATANTLKWAVVAELKAIIDRAGRDLTQGDHLTREALELATHRVTVRAAGARWSTSIRSGAISSPRRSRRIRWS